MFIKDILEKIDYRFHSGSEYQWDCYGPKAFFIDFKDNEGKPIGSAIVDPETGLVFESRVELPGENLCYRWIDPAYKKAYTEEANFRGVSANNAWDDVLYTDLEIEEDFLEKLDSIVHHTPLDRRILVPLDISDAEQLIMFRAAHDADMTVNAFVNHLLESEMTRLSTMSKKELKKEKKKMKKYGQ